MLFGEFLVHRVHRLQCADAGYLLGIYKHGEMFRFTQSTYALTLMNMIRQPFSFDHDAEDYMNSHRTAKQLIDETLHPEITRTWHESSMSPTSSHFYQVDSISNHREGCVDRGRRALQYGTRSYRGNHESYARLP